MLSNNFLILIFLILLKGRLKKIKKMQIAAVFSLIPAYLNDNKLFLNLYVEINNRMQEHIIYLKKYIYISS